MNPPSATASDQAELLAWFTRTDRVTVAFSGGVDSALVLSAAARALGADAVHAVTAVSPSLPTGALDAARSLTSDLGVSHSTVATDEMDRDGYRQNGWDRCYFCKTSLVEAVQAIERSRPDSLLLTGTNADDVRGGWRPGIRAAAERGVATPLADLGIDKARVRQLSRTWGLATWDRPASPCLSSRVAYGIAITPERLARVDRAEIAVRGILATRGIQVRDLRVRDLGGGVRLEVDPNAVAAVQRLTEVPAALADAGFGDIACTVGAFRTGGLNDVLPSQLRYA